MTLSVFGAKNPLATRGGTIDPRLMAVPCHELYRSSDYSTTDTANYYRPLSGVITTHIARGTLFISAMCQVKHSAGAGAEVSVGIEVSYDRLGNGGYTLVRHQSVYIASATLWTPLHFSAAVDLYSFGYIRGEHLVEMAIRNHTAGTLTVQGDLIGWTLDTIELGAADRGTVYISS